MFWVIYYLLTLYEYGGDMASRKTAFLREISEHCPYALVHDLTSAILYIVVLRRNTDGVVGVLSDS